MPCTSNSLFLYLLVPQFGQTSCWLLGEVQIIVKSGWPVWSSPHEPERVSCQSPVILCFGGDISDGSLCIEVSLVLCWNRQFPLLHLCSRQGLVTVDLLDNFLNILKLFRALESNFTKSLWWRMERVRREREMANWLCQSWWQVERGAEAKPSANGRLFKMIFYSFNLSAYHSARYSHHPGCWYPHLKHI